MSDVLKVVESVTTLINQKKYDDVGFQDYFEAVLTPQVVNMNDVYQGVFKDKSPTEMAISINKQIDIVNSEQQEFRDNFCVDPVEELDAIADVLFTVAYFMYQLSVSLDLDEAQTKEFESVLQGERVALLIEDFNNFLGVMYSNYDLPIVIEATDRVVVNNASKFTTDEKEFETWVAPPNEPLNKETRVVDGVEYYMLVNEVGKVRKRDGFVGVDLKDLVEKQHQLFVSRGEVKDNDEKE